jgi:hypothetical protein
MLRAMETMEVNDLVSTMFEACEAFGPAGDGSPVCSGCGWLEAEHNPEPVAASVHRLPRRTSAKQPRRLAS